MVRLKYNLDEIKSQAYEPGRCRAKLKAVKKKTSKAGNPMLEFAWVILTGDNKGHKISSYPSLMTSSLGNLKEHLEALGLKGKISKSSDALLGRIAVLVIAESPSRDGGRPFVGVVQVLPKSSPLVDPDEDDEFDEDDDDFDENDDDEDEDDEDDDDWDDDDDE
ncbi:hypothetical protein LCGC14_1122060 [marine sediment metagenome]|uniref:Uncharacterized protein n=1 Tax=marine sediment metagenome TaxID=412755 RepID=A0A0F9PLU6_9ZZZZ